MGNIAMVQARTPENLKSNAVDILDKLGLNLSTYINMALTQLVIQRRIPFDVALDTPVYSSKEAISEVASSMELEDMPLNQSDINLLEEFQLGNISADELRQRILSEV